MPESHAPPPNSVSPAPSAGGLKVLIVSARYWPDEHGGGEICTRLLAESLVEAGAEVVVLRTRPADAGDEAGDGGPDGETVVGGVRVITVPLANLYWHPPSRPVGPVERLTAHLIDRDNPVMARRVAKIVARERPDLVHTQALEGFSTAVWPAVAKLGIPVVHTTHSYYLLCPPATMRREENCESQCTGCRLFTASRRRHARRVDGVAYISRFMRDRHREAGLFRGTADAVIPNPITPPPDDAGGPAPRGADGGRLRVGYLGRLHPTKGVDLLLDRLAEIPADRYELAIAGEGPEAFTAELRRRAGDLPVRFLGWTDPAAFLDGIDLLAVPSVWHEPFGRVTVEAFAHGVPVVGSPYGGTKELIRTGETGFLFTPEEPGSLRRVFDRLAADPALLPRMSAAVRGEAAAYAPGPVTAAFLRFYDRVLSASPSASTAPSRPTRPSETAAAGPVTRAAACEPTSAEPTRRYESTPA